MKIEDCALLIDGDNVSPDFGEQILQQARKQGNLCVARAYGGAQTANGWVNFPGVGFFAAGIGKNASDTLLSIDAVDLLHCKDIKQFIIVSSDGDFSHVAMRLREHKANVVGIGEEKTPQTFRKACNKFIILKRPAARKAAPQNEKSFSNPNQLDKRIAEMIRQHGDPKQGMMVAELAPRMHAKYKIKISSYPEKNWRGYLSKRPTLFQLDPRGPKSRVRCLKFLST
ncbi:NYN domain-containing protein [Maritalea sp. S77]|uniref:NYN domain-containing protein n=1 Tax=Maritalea sp. S77 TaxID=3415125 RepID=UPI003C7D6DBD